MGVVRATTVTLTGDEAALTLDHPIIGWDNFITTANITADAADANYPATNLANPATHLFWRLPVAASADHYITITPTVLDAVDYVAVAKHNLGTLGIPIGLQYFNGSTWVDMVASTTPTNDAPIIFRINAQFFTDQIRLHIGPTALAAQISVVYAGKLLVLPRKIYQGLVPINYGLTAKVTNGRSEAGNFLGRIVLQEFVRDTIPLSLISPVYFRDHIADFLIDSKENPFFIAWRPESYPGEVGYCHMTNDPMPVNEPPHGLVAMSLEMTGII